MAGDTAAIDLWSDAVDKEVLTYNDLWVHESSTAVLESVISSGNLSILVLDLQVSLSTL